MRGGTAFGLGLAATLLGATWLAGTAQASGLGCSSVASCPTSWNFDPTPPPVGANNFEVVLPGNQTGIVSGNYNSFTSPTNSATYNSGTDQTTITFSGSGLAGAGPYGPGNSPAPHFGFTGIVPGATSGGEKLPPVQMDWSVGGTLTAVPGLGITFHSGSTGAVRYLMLLVSTEVPDGDGASNGADGDSTQNWFELPYQGDFAYSLDATDGSAELSDGHYFISDTQIPLDSLNYNDYPATNPNWQTLPGVPDGTTIQAGGSLSVVPEPAGLALLTSALFGLVALRRRRGTRATR